MQRKQGSSHSSHEACLMSYPFALWRKEKDFFPSELLYPSLRHTHWVPLVPFQTRCNVSYTFLGCVGPTQGRKEGFKAQLCVIISHLSHLCLGMDKIKHATFIHIAAVHSLMPQHFLGSVRKWQHFIICKCWALAFLNDHHFLLVIHNCTVFL